MMINITILSHVSMIDLEGRHALQGAHLSMLLSYFSEFLNQHSDEHTYKELSLILDDLSKKSDEIRDLDSNPTQAKLFHLIDSYTKKILDLNDGEMFYFPGGWLNRLGASHAIIYAFKKNIGDASFDFLIYNGGDGIRFHDEIPSTSSRQYYPVKIYKIPDLRNHQVELENHLRRMILANITHVEWRKKRILNAEILYNQIQMGMTALKATLLDIKSLYNPIIGTQGITANTCAQASIQQLIKVYLNDINAYHTLMVRYKYGTLLDYMRNYPPPYRRVIDELIGKSFRNLMRIVEASPAFAEAEKQIWFERIMIFKSHLISREEAKSKQNIIMSKPHIDIPAIEPIFKFSQIKHQDDIFELKRHSDTPILDRLSLILKLERTEKNFEFISQEIDKFLLDVTLPESSEAFEDPCLAWSDGFTANEWHILINQLNLVSRLYYDAYNTHPTYFVSQWSLLALIDYANYQLSKTSATVYTVHKSISPVMQGYQFFFQRAFFLATKNPYGDKRLLQLQKIYPPEIKPLYTEIPLSIEKKIEYALLRYPWYNVYKVKEYLDSFAYIHDTSVTYCEILDYLQSYSELDYYRTLIRYQSTEQQALLKKIYSFHHSQTESVSLLFYEQIEALELECVYCLFNIILSSHETFKEYLNQSCLAEEHSSQPETISSIYEECSRMDAEIKDSELYQNRYDEIHQKLNEFKINHSDILKAEILLSKKFEQLTLQETIARCHGNQIGEKLLQVSEQSSNIQKIIKSNRMTSFSIDTLSMKLDPTSYCKLLAQLLLNNETQQNKDLFILLGTMYYLLSNIPFYSERINENMSVEQIIAEIRKTPSGGPANIIIEAKKLLSEYRALHAELKWIKLNGFSELIKTIETHRETSETLYRCMHANRRSIKHLSRTSIELSKHNICYLKTILSCLYKPNVILRSNSLAYELNQKVLRHPLLKILKADIPTFQLFEPYPKLLNSHDISCERSTLNIRRLQHLSVANEIRPMLLLGYFSLISNIHELTDLNTQMFFEAYLMEPHALSLWTQKDPASLRQKIKDFSEVGMKYFLNNEFTTISKEGVFVFRIQFFLYRYLFLAYHDKTYLADLIGLYQQMEALLENEANQSSKFKISIYYFLLGMFFLEHHKAYPVDLDKLVSIHIMLQYDSETRLSKLDVTTQIEFDSAKNLLQKKLQIENPQLYQALINLSQQQLQLPPQSLLYSSLMNLFRIDSNTPCLVSLDQDLVVFPAKSNITFIKRQSEWIVQRTGYQLNLKLNQQLPLIYQDDNTLIWQRLPTLYHPDACEIIVERYQKAVFQCSQAGYLQTITQDGEVVFDEEDFVFSHFEHEDFIISIARDDGCRTTTLERYDLIFEKNISGEVIFVKNPNYRLLPFETTPFVDKVACLMLENRKGNSRKCFVPIQIFYIDYSVSPNVGEFYALTHDRKSLLLYPHKQEKHFCYKNSEKYAAYDMDGSELISKSTRDALYLCYLYIATHETQKAWEQLERISSENSFQGTDEEYMMLEWIVMYCPVTLNIDNQDSSHALSLDTINFAIPCSAETIVCQLKTIHLLCMWYHQGNEIHIPNLQSKFSQFLKTSLSPLYQKYQKIRRELPVSWLLNDAECLNLLNMIFIQNPDTAVTALKYEQSQLELKYYWITAEKIKALSLLQPQQQTRLKTLHVAIENIGDIFSIETLISHEIIELSKSSVSKLRLPNQFFLQPLANTLQREEDALHALSTAITLDELCKYFYIYTKIATSDKKTLDKDKLLHTCETLLIGYANDEDNISIFVISGLIYRIIHAPDRFSTLNHDASIHQILAHYSDSTYAPIKKPVLKRYMTSILYKKDALLQSIREKTIIFSKISMPIPHEDRTQMRPAIPSSWGKIEQQSIALMRDSTKAGEMKMALRLEKIAIAKRYVLELDKIHWLRTSTELQKETEEHVNIAFEEAIKFAQKGLKSSAKNRRKIAARLIEPISSKTELFSLYVGRDYATYKTKTALEDSEILDLQQLIHIAVTLEIENQWLIRFMMLLREENTNPLNLLEHIALKNLANQDPLLMMLQRNFGFLLKQNQMNALLTLIEPPSHKYMLSLPMGSGKTKVLLPLLSNHQANGYELSMILVPEHLLETNYRDYQQIILKNLGKGLFLFKFDLEKTCNASILKRIYQQFESIISHQSVCIASDQSMQALALKYNELLYLSYQDGAHLEEIEYEIFYLHQILQLLRKRANVIIDEVHEVLSPNRSLNYTMGAYKSIRQIDIEHSIELFKFIKKYDLITQEEILDRLLYHPDSPLMEGFSAESIGTIRHYIEGQLDQNDTNFIETLSASLKEKLAFYKLHFNRQEFNGESLYEYTRGLRLHVNYGPSKRHDLSPVQRAIAIPYSSNNESMEGSRFGCYWITIHCTILMLLEMGMDTELLNELIKIWRSQKDKNIFDDSLREMNIQIDQIDLDHQPSLNQFLFKINQHIDFLFDILGYHLLPQIELDAITLSSNAYHHVDLYYRTVCTSGTLDEDVCYHSDFIIDNHFSNGNNEYLLNLLKSKHTRIETLDFDTPKTLLQHYYQTIATAKPFSAIIDISARFSGIENSAVASGIADFVTEHQQQIQYILYFDEQDQLCALSVAEPRQIVEIGTTDSQAIFEKLDGCTPDHYVTYFDQTHSFGMDIRQKTDAFALVLTDTKHRIFQGCLRMRDLENEQTISIILPSDSQIDNLDDLVNIIENHHKEKIRYTAIHYTLSKMENLIYQNLMEIILASESSDIETQIRYAKAFESVLIKRHDSSSLYDTYGTVAKRISTETYLENHSETLILKWIKCLHQANIKIKDELKLRDKLKRMIQSARPYCAEETYQSGYRSLSAIVQHKTYHNTSHTSQLQVDEKTLDKSKQLYTALENSQHVSPKKIPMGFKATLYRTLNEWCKTDIFDDNLFASNNYMLFYEDQINPLETGLPLVYCIYSCIDAGKLMMHLISIEEASTMIANHHHQSGWITTIDNQILSGPKNACREHIGEYKRFMEQILYFNGMLLELTQRAESLIWLIENPSLKLNFYETQLATCRGTSRMALNSFKKSLKISQSQRSISRQPLSTEQNMLNQANAHEKMEQWQKAMMVYFRILQNFPQSIGAKSGLQKISDRDYLIRYAIISVLIRHYPEILDLKPSKNWFSIFSRTSSAPFYTKLFGMLTQGKSLNQHEYDKIKKLMTSMELSLKREILEEIKSLKFSHPKITDTELGSDLTMLLKSHLDDGATHEI